MSHSRGSYHWEDGSQGTQDVSTLLRTHEDGKEEEIAYIVSHGPLMWSMFWANADGTNTSFGSTSSKPSAQQFIMDADPDSHFGPIVRGG